MHGQNASMQCSVSCLIEITYNNIKNIEHHPCQVWCSFRFGLWQHRGGIMCDFLFRKITRTLKVSYITLRTKITSLKYANKILECVSAIVASTVWEANMANKSVVLCDGIHVSKNDVKIVMCGYRTLTPKIERKLNSWGFKRDRDNKHYVFLYKDGKETVTFSKTSSDRRVGYNMTREIWRIMTGA